MMTWVNFAMLGVGGLLISVPIVLHFLMQPKPVEMVFYPGAFPGSKQ